MFGLMQDWPLLCNRILDHAATYNAERQIITRSIEVPFHTTNYADLRKRALRVSQRLTTSASCLVAGGAGRDQQLERLLAQQNRGVVTKPILEINMRHPFVAAIAGAKDQAADLSFLLLEQAQILDGELPEDPAAFANRLNHLVLRGISKETG